MNKFRTVVSVIVMVIAAIVGFFLGAMRASHLTDILRGTANNNTLYIVWIYSREGSSSPSPCTMQ